MSFVDEVVEKSVFPWQEYTGHKVVANEDIYCVGRFQLGQYGDELWLEADSNDVGAAYAANFIVSGKVSAAVTAKVIDTLIQNYRDA